MHNGVRKTVVVSLVAWVSIEREFASFINLYLCLCARLWTVCVSAARRRNQTIKRVREKSNNQNPTNTTFPSHSFSESKQSKSRENPGKSKTLPPQCPREALHENTTSVTSTRHVWGLDFWQHIILARRAGNRRGGASGPAGGRCVGTDSQRRVILEYT